MTAEETLPGAMNGRPDGGAICLWTAGRAEAGGRHQPSPFSGIGTCLTEREHVLRQSEGSVVRLTEKTGHAAGG
jgi:hypothetical protein